MRRSRVAAMNRTKETAIDLPVPVLPGRLHKTLAQRQTGIVDQDVDAAKIADDRIHHRFDRGKIRNVGAEGLCVAAMRDNVGGERLCFVARVAIVHGHDCALGRKRARNLATNAALGSRHQRDLSLKLQLHALPSGSDLLACRLKKTKQTGRRDWQLIDLDGERREGIGNGVGHSRRRADGAALAHAAEAAQRGRRFRFEMHDLHWGNFTCRRHDVIGKTHALDLPFTIVHHPLEERRANALGDAAADLAFDNHWIDQGSAILGDDVAIDQDFAGLRIDLDRCDVGGRAGGAENGVIGLGCRKLPSRRGGARSRAWRGCEAASRIFPRTASAASLAAPPASTRLRLAYVPLPPATAELSACTMRISSKRAPGWAATICASVVSSPCPWDAMPKHAVMPPVESIRMTQVSVPVLMGMPGATEMREPIPVSSA